MCHKSELIELQTSQEVQQDHDPADFPRHLMKLHASGRARVEAVEQETPGGAIDECAVDAGIHGQQAHISRLKM